MLKSSDWIAWYNRIPGSEDPYLHVAGKVDLDPGYSIDFEPGNSGPTPIDSTYALIVSTRPTGESPGGRREVSWEDNVGQEVRHVLLQGEVDADISVRIVT
jgi:hypothetical protein